MTKDEALKLALEALEFVNQTGDTQTFDMCYADKAITAIKKSLAQPYQEPVKDWIASHNDICALLRQAHDALALTSYPPQRPWVGLSDEERQEIALEVPIDAVLITEATLKDKNTQKTTGENNLSSD